MASKILHKRSSTVSAIPAAVDLDLGELALNTADGKIYMKKGDNSVVLVGGSAPSPIVANDGNAFAITPLAPGLNAIAIGNNTDTSTFADSFAIGNGITNGSTHQVSVGDDIQNEGFGAIAIGNNVAHNGSGVAIGRGLTTASGCGSSVVIGVTSHATGVAASSVIIGQNSSASARRTVCIGYDVDSTVADQVVIGTTTDGADVTSDVPYSVKIGHGNPLNATDTNLLHLFSKGKLELYGDEAQFVIPSYTTALTPATTVLGGLVYDTTLNALKVYDGAWNAVGGTPPVQSGSCHVSAAGSIVDESDVFTGVTHTASSGIYTVSHTLGFALPVATIAGTVPGHITVTTIASGSYIVRTYNAAGTLTDLEFTTMVSKNN